MITAHYTHGLTAQVCSRHRNNPGKVRSSRLVSVDSQMDERYPRIPQPGVVYWSNGSECEPHCMVPSRYCGRWGVNKILNSMSALFRLDTLTLSHPLSSKSYFTLHLFVWASNLKGTSKLQEKLTKQLSVPQIWCSESKPGEAAIMCLLTKRTDRIRIRKKTFEVLPQSARYGQQE